MVQKPDGLDCDYRGGADGIGKDQRGGWASGSYSQLRLHDSDFLGIVYGKGCCGVEMRYTLLCLSVIMSGCVTSSRCKQREISAFYKGYLIGTMDGIKIKARNPIPEPRLTIPEEK